ncbi:MAG: ABC transporter ATP-binding protein [Candidatus Poseidoniales archaeon]|nr:MAG: ABC transporter ATP-binding protein [Candidatus Poseidoniales archaeon]
MNNPLLSITGVAKRFGEVEALTHVDLTINSGQVIGLVGGNGAGKTTLLRLIAGVMEPTVGTILFEGKQVSTMRSKLGVVPESTGLYSRLTAWENIRYHSRMYGIPDDIAWNRVSHFAKRLELTESLSRHTKGFSRGMRQKTALLRALAHGPDILLLDEPTAGLDVTSARTVRSLVGQLRDEGGTVIYSTHHLAEAQQVCDRIIIVHNGTIRADGSPEELLELTGQENLEEAYVSLTSDKSRTRAEDTAKDGKMAKWWRRFLTGSTPSGKYSSQLTSMEVDDDE